MYGRLSSSTFVKLNNVLRPYRLGEDFPHHFARHIGEPEIAAVEAVRQPFVIDPQEMQDRGVEIIDRNAIDDRSVAFRHRA